METPSHETRAPTELRRHHCRWAAVSIAALVVIGMVFGAWALLGNDDTDGLAAAVVEYAEPWDIVWVTGDGDTFAALYSDNGTWTCPLGTKVGRDAIRAHAVTWGRFDDMRHGETTETDEGVFVFPNDAVWEGARRAGEVTITAEGDLVTSSTPTWTE